MSLLQRALLGFVVAIATAGCAGAPAGPTASPASPTVLPQSTTTVSTATPAPSPAGLPAFDPNEPLLLYGHVTGAGGGIFVMRPDGSGRTQLGTDVLPGVHKRGNWSPDGQDVVFVDETTERLWIAHLDGRPTSPVATCTDRGCDFPVWSPDGTKIAYSRVESKDGIVGPASVGIEVIDLASGVVTQVVRLNRPTLADVPKWSPDGKQIVVQVDRMDDEAFETGAALAVVPAAGGEPTYLTKFDAFASSPDWSWANDEIVFSTDLMDAQRSLPTDQNTWNLWGVQPDGSGLRRITNLPDGGRLKGPIWTPDGNALFAYDLVASQGVKVDPRTGAVEPSPTGANGTRPSLRPLPTQ